MREDLNTGKVRALNPLVRRVVGYETDALLPIQTDSEVPDCPDCGGIGIRPAGSDIMLGCTVCRSDALQILVMRPADKAHWIACREIPGVWGRGGSAVEALLEMERGIDESQSMFASRYQNAQPMVPVKCYVKEEELTLVMRRCQQTGTSLPNYIRSRILEEPPTRGASAATGSA